MLKDLFFCFKRFNIPNEIIFKIIYEHKGLESPISRIVKNSLYSGQFFISKYKSKADYLNMFIKCDICNNIIDYNMNICIMVSTSEIRWYLPLSNIKQHDDSFTIFIYNKFYPNESVIYYTFLNKILKENLTIVCSTCDSNYWKN